MPLFSLPMQDALFPDESPAADTHQRPAKAGRAAAGGVQPAPFAAELQALAEALPPRLFLGTSTWSYPGWAGQVWDRAYSDALLAKKGLSAYAQHPLLRSVCIDRSFYRPLTASQYEAYAAQVPAGFRFVVKAPALVADALVRDDQGHGSRLNPAFLDPDLAVQEFVQPALEGLGAKIGALVFQLSPLPAGLLQQMPALIERLDRLLAALPVLQPLAPDGVIAVEVRDAAWLSEDFVAVLKRHGATYCLGLHPKLPPPEEQLWLLRRLWPGPFVCRWNLNRLHGPYGYEAATRKYGAYDAMVDPDPQTRALIAKVARATAQAGQAAYVTINNKAEGCAPQSVAALARAVSESPDR